MLRCGALTTFLAFSWDLTNILFTAYMTHPLLLSQHAAQPNKALVEGLQLPSEHKRLLALLELAHVVRTQPARRVAIFRDVPNGKVDAANGFQLLANEALGVLDRARVNAAQRGNPPAPAQRASLFNSKLFAKGASGVQTRNQRKGAANLLYQLSKSNRAQLSSPRSLLSSTASPERNPTLPLLLRNPLRPSSSNSSQHHPDLLIFQTSFALTNLRRQNLRLQLRHHSLNKPDRNYRASTSRLRKSKNGFKRLSSS